MDADLKRRVDALRRPLELAAADNFAGVRKISGLGHVLRIACDSVLAKQPVDGLETWRQTIERWETLDDTQQAIEVARGMRLLARIPKPAGATIEREQARAKVMANAPSPIVERSTTRLAPVPVKPAAPSAPSASSPATTNADAAAKPVAAKSVAAKVGAPTTEPTTKKTKAKPDIEVDIDPLAQPTFTLPGIGPAFAERLAEKGLVCVEDLLWTLPRRYDDVRDAKQLGEALAMDDGMRVTFAAKVTSRA